MSTLLIALALLAAAVGAIVLLLKNMGQDGVEIAAPGSCKSGRCGVRKQATEEADPAEVAEENPPRPENRA
jgi:hypothetical protein